MPPQVTHSSIAHRKRQHDAQTLKAFQASMSVLTESTQSLPHHFIINMWAWYSGNRLGQPVRVGLHPSVGLKCWQSAVSIIFEACHAGIGDTTVHTGTGEPLHSYEAFLQHFAAEKGKHDRRYSALNDEQGTTDRVWQGPRAPVAHRVADVDRVFYLDVVCCSRGAPFACPRQLQENICKRNEIDARHAQRELAPTERAPSPVNTRRVIPQPIRNDQFGEQKVVLFNSASSQSKRRDNPLVHRAAVVDEDAVSEDDTSMRQGTFDDAVLMKASTRLRRLSSAAALLSSGPQILERAQSMRKKVLLSLYKDDAPEDSLAGDAILQLQTSMRRESMRVAHDTAPNQQAPPHGSPTRLSKFAPLSKGGRGRVGDGSPKRGQSKSGDLSFLEDASSSAVMSHSLHSPGSERRSRHVQPTGPKSFPLGVVRNRLHEHVKLDGGVVLPGMLVTSAETGEMYKVEALDRTTNTAHCRWVLRAPDPLLSHFVQCTENSLLHRMNLGDHYVKYEFHWLRRLQMGRHLAVLQRAGCAVEQPTRTTARGLKGTPPMDTTPFEEHLDDSMMCFGHVPREALDPFSRHRHHASPMMQRRIQRNGGFCDDDDDDSDDELSESNASGTDTAAIMAAIAQLSPADLAVLKDFEALFPSGNKKGRSERLLLEQQVCRQLPSLVTSRQVSFITDVCTEVKLSNLKPTTTFRFLMWIDLGFVLALRLTMEQYRLLPMSDECGRIPEADATARQPRGDAMEWFMRSSMASHGALGHVPFHAYNVGAGKASPVEGCGGHERSAGAEGDGGTSSCTVCGFHFASTDAQATEQEKITMLL